MSNSVVLPLLLPFIAAILAAFFPKRMAFNRIFSLITYVVTLLICLFLAQQVFANGALVLETGDWQAPYGIILVADPLASVLIIITQLVALATVLNARQTLHSYEEKAYFYFFFNLLIVGVTGSFLTGDLFNLFVFFEVLLMASYGLIVLGGRKAQFREAVKYILINLFSSILFVMTVSFVYGITGTVNMAHIAQRVPELADNGAITGAAILLFIVFATKSALFPLYVWLPKSYIAPPTAISIVFGALLTKVGVYAILRVFTILFPGLSDFTSVLFLVIAGVTMVFGVLGALSTNNVKLIIAYNIIPSIGFMMMGIGIGTATSYAGTVYYLINDMALKAALFLLIGVLVTLAGTTNLKQMGGYIRQAPWAGWLFFIACITLAGLPPFSGFIGKYLLLQAAFDNGHYLLGAVALLTSLLILFSVLRIFIYGFWGESDDSPPSDSKNAAARFRSIVPAGILLLFTLFLGLGAEFVLPYIDVVSHSLLNPENYITPVLKE
nr:Na+/H+ antiporter subunit D [Aureibacillus halotolerans]